MTNSSRSHRSHRLMAEATLGQELPRYVATLFTTREALRAPARAESQKLCVATGSNDKLEATPPSMPLAGTVWLALPAGAHGDSGGFGHGVFVWGSRRYGANHPSSHLNEKLRDARTSVRRALFIRCFCDYKGPP